MDELDGEGQLLSRRIGVRPAHIAVYGLVFEASSSKDRVVPRFDRVGRREVSIAETWR